MILNESNPIIISVHIYNNDSNNEGGGITIHNQSFDTRFTPKGTGSSIILDQV